MRSSYDIFLDTTPHLFWDVADPHSLLVRSVVDRSLRRGEMEEINQLIKILSSEIVKKEFYAIVNAPRSDFPPRFILFFRFYLRCNDADLGIDSLARAKSNALMGQ